MIKQIKIKINEKEESLENLFNSFDFHLKRKEGIFGFEKAKRRRKAICENVEKFISSLGSSIDLETLYNATKEKSVINREINYFKNFLEEYFGFAQTEKAEIEARDVLGVEGTYLLEEKGIKDEEPPLIGRVALTINSPAKTSEFTFWISEERKVPIEPGMLVSAISDNAQVSVLGIISDVEAKTDMNSPIESFYGHGVGNPNEDIPTSPVIITTANVEVVYRSDKRAEPIMGSWKVRPAKSDEIRKAYGSEIDERDEFLLGFSHDWRGDPVPVPAHIGYILGPEAAHINISGTAGAATKTSYAVFLIFSLLAHSKAKKLNTAIIALNVKEADLLRIDDLPSWQEIANQRGPDFEHIRLWKILRELPEPYPIDPYTIKDKFTFFAPKKDDGTLFTLRQYETKGFRYSALELADTNSLHLLLDPQDLDDKSMAVIWSLTEEIKNDKNKFSFEQALGYLKERCFKATSSWDISIAGVPHHRDTVYKVRNRLENAIRYQLSDLLVKSDRIGLPIPLWEIRAGNLWVIDISRLIDKGQRLIFHWIMKAIHTFLEKKRSGIDKIYFLEKEVDLKEFPERVVIFVDELNKFAPWGTGISAIKQDIVEIAARGRSIGLSLIGAEQLASKVDEEILANTSTFAVGRSHPVEIGKTAIYGWLSKGLRDRATTLERGKMIIWHGAHRRPVFIYFPKPLHAIKETFKNIYK